MALLDIGPRLWLRACWTGTECGVEGSLARCTGTVVLACTAMFLKRLISGVTEGGLLLIALVGDESKDFIGCGRRGV